MKPIIIIPARLAATRLPRKPLADIHGMPMIVQVLRRAEESQIGPVLVAAGDAEIVDAIEKAGGTALLTDPALPSGSDRIYAALMAYDKNGSYDVVINLQGDSPMLDPAILRTAYQALQHSNADIMTLAARITDDAERTNPNVVKAVLGDMIAAGCYSATTFTRKDAAASAPAYHHIGVYMYRRAALEKFVMAPPSPDEISEKLEQLRALAIGLSIHVCVVDTIPQSVDTPDDLEKMRRSFIQREQRQA